VFADVRFDLFLDGIGELHAFMRKKFYAVVLVRIVRGGDHDADVKIILADEASDAGSGKNSRKGNGGAVVEKASGDDAGDMRTGFARVSADERVGRRMIAMKKLRNGAAKGKESAVIEGSGTGDATDAVRAEKLSRHRVKGH